MLFISASNWAGSGNEGFKLGLLAKAFWPFCIVANDFFIYGAVFKKLLNDSTLSKLTSDFVILKVTPLIAWGTTLMVIFAIPLLLPVTPGLIYAFKGCLLISGKL